MFCPACGSWNRGDAARCIRCDSDLPVVDSRPERPDADITSLRHVIGGRYSVSHRIGDGGMATVYYAIHTALDRPVVLKVLHPHLARDADMRERFRREAETAAQLVHPHVCNIIDFGMSERHVYTVMPYLSRGTLGDRISGRRAMAPERVAVIGAQVASALDYANRHGVVHRDIKPDNVLFDEDEHAVVTDFGIATAHFRGRMTGTGHVMGTPHYMSPEQSRGRLLDGRSDLYTLGVVLYETLVGFVPFDGADIYSITSKHLEEMPVAPDIVDSRVPAALSAVVMRCLCKDPAERYQRGNDLADALIQYLAQSGASNPEKRGGWLARTLPSFVSPS
ncbi:MAG: serine/threonine-protein kinase [Gemmatimonadaceae bacterium]